MKSKILTAYKILFAGFSILIISIFLMACGGGHADDNMMGSSDGNIDDIFPPPSQMVSGRIITEDTARTTQSGSVINALNFSLTLDDDTSKIPVDDQGYFEMMNITNGNHSLFIHHPDGGITDVPFRMMSGRGMGMGTITIMNERVEDISGFDGYHFGFIDEDGNGINDQFMDSDGDGICDPDTPYAGYPYAMDMGYIDDDGDGINDRFRDADGDGVNDLDGMPYGHGFGFIDNDHNGINDQFMDINGDGISDLTGIPFSHPFGYMDENGDGINDLFKDGDGDGVNDITNESYVAMPGWVDLDGDGVNDFFRDADGNGMDDISGMPYPHGFGWVDQNGDGINDLFIDANGNRINDYASGSYAHMSYQYGFIQAHIDVDGNGIDDISGMPYPHGFGWVDNNQDNINDVFTDMNGLGINDLTGYHFHSGYMLDNSYPNGMMGTIDWPMLHMGGGMMGS